MAYHYFPLNGRLFYFSFIIISLTVAITPYCLGADPVSWWKLDETSGTAAIDSSGNGHNGTLKNTSGLEWKPADGISNGCIYFNNINTYSAITVPSTGMTATAGTIMLWGKLSDT